MRDDAIYRMHEANVRRVMLLLRQFEFLQTRMQAFEEILSNRAAMMKAFLDPDWMKRAVDNRQKELLREAEKQMEKAMAKPAIKPIIVASGTGNG